MRKGRELNPVSSGRTQLPTAISNKRVCNRNETIVIYKIYKKQLFIVFFSGLLFGCASPGDTYESAGDPVATRGKDCILQSTIRDYQVLDDRNLIVTASAKRKYHVELSRRAQGLRSNWSIGFKSPSGRVCSGFSEILVDDGFGRKEAIALRSVREVNPDELNALLIQFGKKVPEEQQVPAEEEVSGAEVEELG